MVDTHVYLSRWPFRRLRGDEPADLLAKLRKGGVTEAWAGSFDGLLHKDVSAVNARLAADCHAYGKGFLLPFGTINPSLPGWQEDLRRCHEEHGMAGIRLHPNYHGYELKDTVAGELMERAAARGLAVQVVCAMEDERTQHPLVRVPNVNVAPLAGLVRRIPKLRLQVLNLRGILPSPEARALADAGQVYFDFAMVEGPGGVERLQRAVPRERIVFASCFPLLYFEAGMLKIRESAVGREDLRAMLETNPRSLLGRSG